MWTSSCPCSCLHDIRKELARIVTHFICFQMVILHFLGLSQKKPLAGPSFGLCKIEQTLQEAVETSKMHVHCPARGRPPDAGDSPWLLPGRGDPAVTPRGPLATSTPAQNENFDWMSFKALC